MKTLTTVMDQFTNPEILYSDLLETLREIDPSFAQEEAQFTVAVSRLKEELSEIEANNLDTYLRAAREEIAAAMVYTGWLGFRLNLDCWQNPVNKLVLDQDYEDITQERTFAAIPTIQQARLKAETAAKAIPEDQEALLSDIGSFFSYLHTAAPKLAHLFGFRLADELLYRVVPGYCHDAVCTMRYAQNLEHYLGLSAVTC